MKNLLVAWMCCLAWVSPVVAAEGVVISEFMASNARTLADEDGDFPDWIEVFNPTAAPVDLAGYSLTDDPALLTKWTFPSVTLPAGGYLVVFASGKNRTGNPTRLHTNFQLDGNGEFLALVKPDGVTPATLFNPAYPAQKEDVAYGTAQKLQSTLLLTATAPSILVPTNIAQLPPDWTEPAFSPGTEWLSDTPPPAIGFDTNQVTGAPANVAPSGAVAQSTINGSFTPNLAVNGNFGDFTHTLGTDSSPFWQVALTNQTAIYSVILFNRTSCCGSRLRDITIEILSTNASGEVINYRSALLNAENVGYAYPNGPAALTNDLVVLTGGPVLGQIVRVRRTPDPDLSGSGGQGNADEATVLSLGEVNVMATAASGLRPYFRTDLQSVLWNKNASAFLRLPFALAEIPDTLTLRARYDDGFVAYVNGVEVARRNAPASLAWNSSATADRNLAAAIVQEVIDVSAVLPQLVLGTNVLAVQVLNADASNSDLLFQPELVATRVSVSPFAYLVDATPGAVNNTDHYFGDVADTTFSVDRGFFDAPFSLEIRSATPGAEIWYSFNSSEPGPGRGGQLYTGPLTITNTTVVRARAFKEGLKPTDVDTQTYLFLDDVIYQAANWQQTRMPPTNFPATWGANAVDYGMDPNVVSNFTLAQWREALTQIPTMSIVTEMPNLFDATIGIYANATGHGELWERPASLELIEPTNAVPGRFQENCGIRIRGGYSRNPQFVRHAFRVFFRREYGAGKLNYPLFGDEGASEFDTFDLRNSSNYAWWRENPGGTHDTFVREVWCRETLGAMGQPYRRSRYYHLYLNGQYWGITETDERPEASFGSTYLGGSKDDYDVVKCANHVGGFATEVTDGTNVAWRALWEMSLSMLTNSANSNYFRILGRNPDGTRNPALPVMLDVDNLIDYMLGIFYSGDGDATLSAFLSNTRPNNWFGMKNRNNPDQGFIFVNSDCEHTLGAPSSQADRTGPWKDVSGSNVGNFTYSNPQYFHEELMLNAEYRLRFADHVQKHFFNGGALTFEQCTNRWWRRANQITKAIRAYSARWGDTVREPPYTESDWTNALNWVARQWFPSRLGTVLAQLKADQLYPSTLTAPNFSQFGGEVTNGFPLLLSQTNASGVIYYTLDGTDPRLVGGAISGGALAYTNTVSLADTLRVKARVYNAGTWSALTEADFAVPGSLPLRITEIMFHPAPVTAAEIQAGFTNAEDFEYIELRNTGPRALSLAGVSFVNGITFSFLSGTLAAGERLLLVKNLAAFHFRYGPAANIAGTYQGNLSNGGERLRLQDALGRTILDFRYGDGWAPLTDGHGFSLVINNDTQPAAMWGNKTSWRASSALGGSPGAANPPPPVLVYVVINEVLSRPMPGGKVSVELANLGDTPATVTDWWLSDDFRAPQKYRLPMTTLPAGGYVVFTEDDFSAPAQGTNALLFSAGGGEVHLFSADAAGELTGYYQGWNFSTADEGVSFGRHVTSTGAEHFVPQTELTLGDANAGPRVGPIAITEIMYRPPDYGPVNNTDDEFVELFNFASTNVALFDPVSLTNTWQVRGGIDYFFPTNVTLAAGERLLVVNFNPATNPDALARFRALYNVPAEVQIFGPYAGQLDNSGEDVEIKRPTLLPTGFYATVEIEEVDYRDSDPWPAGADGYGLSLQRRDPSAYGNDPANWGALLPSAGGAASLNGTPPTIVAHPASRTLGVGWTASVAVQASGSEPLRYQWRLGGMNLSGATNTTLDLTPVSMSSAGNYRVLVHNDAGSVVSEPATIVTRTPPQMLAHPQAINVRIKPDSQAAPSTNVTFTAAATSASPWSYQWLFNGQPIPGATSAMLTISNVQASHWGQYALAATDEIGTSVSDPAWLNPMIRPGFSLHPIAQSVVVSSPVSFSAIATGWPPPFTFEWRRSSTVLTTNVQDSQITFFSFTASSVPSTNAYRAVIKNVASPGGVASLFATNITLADTDADGMPDEWEISLGLDPTNAVDGLLDFDADGALNWQEYLAGTDPTNAQSVLKLEMTLTDGLTLRFEAVSNRTYSVQCASDPVVGPWLSVADFHALATTRPETVIQPVAATNRFYRVVHPRQP